MIWTARAVVIPCLMRTRTVALLSRSMPTALRNPREGHAQGDTIANFENATGSAHNDSLTGDEGSNTLKGGGGDDDLDGKLGKRHPGRRSRR